MKVLFFARALGPGGAERQMALLAGGLSRRGHDVTVVTFYPGGNFLPEVVCAGAKHVSLEKRGRWDIFAFAVRFRQILKQQKPDIVYSYLPPPNIIATILAGYRGGPCRVWGVRVSEMRLECYDWLQRLSYFMEFHLARTAHLIIFNAKSGAERARLRGMAIGHSAIVANGIDADRFVPDLEARRKLREQWNVVNGEAVIGMIARFDPMKDHRTFLAAAAAVSLKRPKVRLVLAGFGVEESNSRLIEMLRAAGLLENTILLGERSDMPAIMAALDILCLSSAFGEGFPNVLGEAMAVGVPCVTTDVGDAGEVVGSTGEVVPPENAEALALAMDRLLTRLAQAPDEIRRNARSRVVEMYSVDRLVERTEEVLMKLLQTAKRDYGS